MATIKDYARMCNAQEDCNSCPMGEVGRFTCQGHLFRHPETAEKIIDKWVKENAKVNMERFIKVGETYRHFKGFKARVLNIAKHTETGETRL